MQLLREALSRSFSLENIPSLTHTKQLDEEREEFFLDINDIPWCCCVSAFSYSLALKCGVFVQWCYYDKVNA